MPYDSTEFDISLACLFPLAILLVAFKLSGPWTWSGLRNILPFHFFKKSSHGPYSLARAHQSYVQYNRLSSTELSYKRASYNALGRAHQRIGRKLGYPTKLHKLKEITDLNTTVTDRIAGLAENEFSLDPFLNNHIVGDLGRVRESLKHYVRDWSEEGAQERERIFQPILSVLKNVEHSERSNKKILVPGSGLGRLAWEISQLGFDTTANELSFFMNLAFRFLLSPETTSEKNEHVIRPYAHWFSHQRSNDSLFRAISFPDSVPRITPNFHLAETDFLSLLPPIRTPIIPSVQRKSNSEHTDAGYDYIVTLFFLDTSLNAFATMEHIYSLLRPGGVWINLGPLLWTSGGQAKLELSLDEVLHAVEEIGFVLQNGSSGDNDVMTPRTVDCEYTGDLNAMMRWIYKAEFWVATKVKETTG